MCLFDVPEDFLCEEQRMGINMVMQKYVGG